MKNPLVYAYIGDCIYEFYIRKFLVEEKMCKLKEIQRRSLNTQGFLTNEEEEIVKWGRNAHGGKAKHTDIVTYRIATGLECLIGYLYYQNNLERIEQIMKEVIKNESIW